LPIRIRIMAPFVSRRQSGCWAGAGFGAATAVERVERVRGGGWSKTVAGMHDRMRIKDFGVTLAYHLG